jgi:hypothetical protein
MTKLFIRESITYEIDHDGTPAETIREFLRDPNHYLIAIENREVLIEDAMTAEEEIEAYEAISDAEMNG